MKQLRAWGEWRLPTQCSPLTSSVVWWSPAVLLRTGPTLIKPHDTLVRQIPLSLLAQARNLSLKDEGANCWERLPVPLTSRGHVVGEMGTNVVSPSPLSPCVHERPDWNVKDIFETFLSCIWLSFSVQAFGELRNSGKSTFVIKMQKQHLFVAEKKASH